MSRWTDQWRDFVRETSYVRNLREEKISNDQFKRRCGIYDQVLMLSGYPGDILTKISSFIPAKPAGFGGKWAAFSAGDALLYLIR